ncbi:ribonuclease MRP protein subunit POP4-like [Nicotiana tomentosiformis]|uniref:ribonuclease MRP protein subunit POP4-like n=1 Tax=Nicotiana tomentosiformis TaxID=4098 RepID=UPI00051AB796|nr:uncharacterized protein LOC104102307 [Nicotiana tomentosiformis]
MGDRSLEFVSGGEPDAIDGGVIAASNNHVDASGTTTQEQEVSVVTITTTTTTTTTTIAVDENNIGLTSQGINSKAKATSSAISSKKGYLSFCGHTSAQDVELNNPAYLQLSHAVDENLLKTTTEISSKIMTVNDILHDLLQHCDSAQKYMQGSKNVKVDNWILLDNVVQKSSIASGARIRALQRQSKRSKRRMSMKQHKKFGSFDLPQEFHNYNIFKPMHDKWKDFVTKLLKNIGKNQLSQCLLNADLHGALILVVQCKIAGLSGVRGIMIRETVETFGIITNDNRFQVVPKKLSVFMLQVDCWKVTLLGDKLSSRNMIT